MILQALAPNELPRRMKRAAVLCVVLSGLFGVFSGGESIAVARADDAQEREPSRLDQLGPLSPQQTREINEKISVAQHTALEGMRSFRVFVLAGLFLSCALCFVASGRLVRPLGASRESMRKLLVGSAVAVAAFRTLDAAQGAVIWGKVGAAYAKVTAALPETDPAVAGHLQPFIVGAYLVWSAGVVGAFLLLSQYFRQPHVRTFLVTAAGPDGHAD